ncbi:hypothetical protein SAMN03080617_04222 [Algoriphagus alkaliphilus]|uniref:Uncharacterized protein n=1 Tax=Algoriphagus alkaliphilus TaxID=279824 RepID=A0A1G5ZPD6_9BACT|nr:hypothetical protein SAMN03080617_04222 [Algoriphagus alkaliphilus]
MKNQLFLISGLLFFLLILSCTPSKEKENQSELQFVVTEKYKTFPLPQDFGHSDLYFQLLQGTRDFRMIHRPQIHPRCLRTCPKS